MFIIKYLLTILINMHENCSICLEEIKDNNSCILRCKHQFHLECIFRMVEQKNGNHKQCPLCRKYMYTLPRNFSFNISHDIMKHFYMKKENDYIDFKLVIFQVEMFKYTCKINLVEVTEDYYSTNEDDNTPTIREKAFNSNVKFPLNFKKYFDYDNDDEPTSKIVNFLFKINLKRKKNKLYITNSTLLGTEEDIDFEDYTQTIPCLGFEDIDMYDNTDEEDEDEDEDEDEVEDEEVFVEVDNGGPEITAEITQIQREIVLLARRYWSLHQ